MDPEYILIDAGCVFAAAETADGARGLRIRQEVWVQPDRWLIFDEDADSIDRIRAMAAALNELAEQLAASR